MVETIPILLFATALGLGLGHGIDWDHVAAIMDITSTQSKVKRGLFLGFMYAVGHSSVVIILGLLAVFLGLVLPDWVNGYMEPVVGITLILLGVYVIYAFLKFHPNEFRMTGRWILVAKGIVYFYDLIIAKFTKKPIKHTILPSNYGPASAYAIGTIHGIGAETPTQIMIFVLAAGIGGVMTGFLLIALFVLGLTISNFIISIFGTLGYTNSTRKQYIYRSAALITAIFSLAIGTFFLFRSSAMLPVL